jgi:branched-chain amino acid transport system substrate-binding protein
VVDDKTNPAEAVQGASKLIDDAKVDFATGFSSSNTMIPIWKTFNDAGIFAVGALAGPLQFAGKECLPNGFVISFSNDDWPAAVGKYMSDKGVKSAFFIGADYQAGYEHVGAAIRYFKGKAIGPVYTPLSQLDFAPEIARIRAEKPDAIFAFLVGAGGVAFSKQYAQAGLQGQIPFYTRTRWRTRSRFPPGRCRGRCDHGHELDGGSRQSRQQEIRLHFHRQVQPPAATFAALGYDAVKLIDAAVRDVGGKIGTRMRYARRCARRIFESVRGSFKFNNNHFPIQNSTSWR